PIPAAAAYYRLRCGDDAQPIYSANVAAFIPRAYPAGHSLIANPLTTANSSLNSILSLDDTAVGATVYKWVGDNFQSSVFLGSGLGWIPEASLSPDEGAFLVLAAPANVRFVGTVAYGETTMSLPEGLALIAVPIPPPDPDETLETLGFPAVDGDTIYQFED